MVSFLLYNILEIITNNISDKAEYTEYLKFGKYLNLD